MRAVANLMGAGAVSAGEVLSLVQTAPAWERNRFHSIDALKMKDIVDAIPSWI